MFSWNSAAEDFTKERDLVKILARQLTFDLYNCKNSKLREVDEVKGMLQGVLLETGCSLPHTEARSLSQEHFVLVALFAEGHILLHVYPAMRYVAGDIFLCTENAAPEEFFKGLRRFFQPDETKTTFFKRGNFQANTEIKPKTKTRVAPLRRIHNTGAKVIRILARRNRQ